jgi:hypothetical protein
VFFLSFLAGDWTCCHVAYVHMLRKIHGKDLFWRVVLLFSSAGEHCQYIIPVIFTIVSSVN